MACKGLVVVSDNWYPGWTAEVDGRPAKIWKVNTVIRGVVVEPGKHQVVDAIPPVYGLFRLRVPAVRPGRGSGIAVPQKSVSLMCAIFQVPTSSTAFQMYSTSFSIARMEICSLSL